MNEEIKKKLHLKKLKPVKLLDGIEELRQDFEERIEQGDTTYGLEILDDCVETIRKGSITAIVASPNTGKSLCAQNIAVHLAKQNKRVIICSCEMGAGLLMERQFKQLLGTTTKQLKEAYEDNRDTANGIMDSLIEDKTYNYLNLIDVVETGGATVYDILDMLEIFPEYEYIIVDYIQRIRGTGTDYEVISEAFAEFQNYARLTGKKLIICSQANRNSKRDAQGNQNQKNNIIDPTRIMGKGSGSIEEDADVGISLLENPEGQGIIITLFKNRYGAKKNISYTYRIDERLMFRLIKRSI